MFLLLIVYISSISYSVCAKIHNSFLSKKAIGMQTLYDKVVILATNCYNLEAWSFTLVFTLTTASQNWSPIFASIIGFICAFTVMNTALVVIILALVRFVSIGWYGVFETSYTDGQIVRMMLLIASGFSVIILSLDFILLSKIDTLIWFVLLTGQPLEHISAPVSSRIILFLSVLTLVLLQVYIEAKRFSEGPNGSIINWLRSFVSSNDSVEDNQVDDSISLHRVLLSFILILVGISMFVNPFTTLKGEKIPTLKVVQILIINVLILGLLVSKGKSMKTHIMHLISNFMSYPSIIELNL